MANLFNGTPFVIDTAWAVGAIPAALTALINGPAQAFRRIVWTNPAATTDTLIIMDVNSNVLFSEACAVAKQDVVLWDNNQSPYKFKNSLWAVTTIGSGKLLLYK